MHRPHNNAEIGWLFFFRNKKELKPIGEFESLALAGV